MKHELPTKPGQVAAIWVSETHIPKEQYILCEKPKDLLIGGKVKVCSISELQRATHKKREPECEYIPLHNLYVIAESLQEYVDSWNKPK